ncbi:MAG: hypothetical protein DWH91_03645 [Planctomycetota bacterium]|nr:MAG: hypothetical protein DWH91_03645 [Planctomycetota bacterium]
MLARHDRIPSREWPFLCGNSVLSDQLDNRSESTSDEVVAPANSSAVSPFQLGDILTVDSSQTQYYADPGAPTHLGRYVIEGYLGNGGFGVVYRSRDEQLNRFVAIKVPHKHRVQTDAERQQYLQEAQTVAQLDHSGIVPVYDFGVLSDGRCFVVSKLIDGRNLAQILGSESLTIEHSIKLLVSVAETLDYIHSHKLIHRDIKPSNLLIDQSDRIFVADFGLALHEADVLMHRAGAGTPSYMSPEQAGGEGHRIDFRTDLYSLGTVMYEMLTGVRPIQGANFDETRRKLVEDQPLSLLTHKPAIPIELNWICLKLLSKRASDRYSSGRELADDLRCFLSEQTSQDRDSAISRQMLGVRAGKSDTPGKFIPRGLRSYDRHDAYFFLRLLAGPFDRAGLPESISHWVRWVQQPDDQPELHRIGVLAGPSGCGKSSLMRAGLAPLLGKVEVSTLIFEATIDNTEQQLSTLLVNRFPGLESETTLTDKLTAVRRGKGLPAGQKLLIVIDQFEQWLHSVHERDQPELIRALRQCDGHRLQCIVLVRDDFWMALNRFMESVETPLIVGKNVRMVDLFDLPHARAVLTLLGQAYDRLPSGETPLSKEARQFIDMAVDYLTKDGKVFPVHLSLFAEMVKARDWVPATLSQLGGAVGVGVQFLRESFSAAHAPVGHRIHEDGVRRLLGGLLPDVGTQIKTRHLTYHELHVLSGYGDDLKHFEGLMNILEGQLKLICPVDALEHSRSVQEVKDTELHYQLSHDFLVPSIREWLYSEQRKTYSGRCRLMLSERSAIWNSQPARRNLPLWRDWIQYRLLLRSASLTEPERRMLRAADRQLIAQTVMGILLFVLAVVGFQGYRSWSRGHALVAQLQTMNAEGTPSIIKQLQPHRRFAESQLNEALALVPPDSNAALNLRLAQLTWDTSAIEPLLNWAMHLASPSELLVIREALISRREQCLAICWTSLAAGAAPQSNDAQRQQAFRAAILLARLDPPRNTEAQQRWLAIPDVSRFLTDETVDRALRNPDNFRALVDGTRPVAELLRPTMAQVLGQTVVDDRARSKITFLRTYYENDDQALAELVIQGAPWQWDDLRPLIKSLPEKWLLGVLQTPRNTSSQEAEIRWEHQISAAAALLLSIASREESWALLTRNPQPGVRALVIDRMAQLGARLEFAESRLKQEVARNEQGDSGILSGLIMAIGQYPQVATRLQELTRQQVRILYETHPDAGVHSAADWLMRKCDIPRNTPLITTPGVAGLTDRKWRLTPEGHLMVRIDGTNEPGIGRVYEICATEVTVRQFLDFQPFKHYSITRAPQIDCPINIVKWPEAMMYSDWLSARHGLSRDQFCTPPGESGESYDQQLQRLYSWEPGNDPAYLDREGYRLPTLAEWEFACCAETKSQWYFGNSPQLMPAYAWHYNNSREMTSSGYRNPVSRPVGLLLPNAFGLFDCWGNAMEWTFDGPSSALQRFVVGGNCTYEHHMLKLKDPRSTPTNTEFDSLGYRIARTISPGVPSKP